MIIPTVYSGDRLAKSKTPYYAGLKGLTAKDRKKWEKRIVNKSAQEDIDWYNGLSEEEKDKQFAGSILSDYYEGNPTVDLSKISLKDAISMYNMDYDLDNNIINKYEDRVDEEDSDTKTEEQELFESYKTYNSKDRIVGNMTDIFKNNLEEDQKKVVESKEKFLTKKDQFGKHYVDYSQMFNNKDFSLGVNKNYDENNFKNDYRYYEQVEDYSKYLRNEFEKDKDANYRAYTKFNYIAEKISPEYRMFKDSSKLGLDAGSIMDIMSNYYAISDLEGEEEANRYLSMTMQNRLAYNQTIGEKRWNGFKGMGNSAYSSLVGLAGSIINIPYALSDEGDIEGLNGWQNFWNKFIDNDLTRYAQDVLTYQTWKPDDIAKLKQIGWDKGNLYKTVQEVEGDLGDMIFSPGEGLLNPNFIPEMISQHGFTVASTIVSLGATGALNLLGKGIKKGVTKTVEKTVKKKAAQAIAKGTSEAAKAAVKAENSLHTTEKALQWLSHYAGKISGWFGAGLAGTSESLTNGLEAKDELMTKGTQAIEDKIIKDVNAELEPKLAQIEKTISDRIERGYYSSMEEANSDYQMLYDIAMSNAAAKYEPLKQKMLDRLKVEAVQAQNTNFAFNQAVTGFLNSTLKATVMHPSVQRTWGKWINRNIDKTLDGNWLRKGWYYGKKALSEPFGEGVEEWVTEGTKGFSVGFHNSDFEHYLNNSTNATGQEGVDTTWAACMLGGMKGAGQSLISKEAAYSFIAGAVGSGASVVNLQGIGTAIQTFKNPNANAWDKFKALSSVAFRSSIFEGISSAKADLDAARIARESANNFMADPKNSATHTSVVTMAGFMDDMDKSTASELDYRNSKLGMTVAEINALERIKESNPIYYQTVMNKLNGYKTITADSEEGRQAIAEFRNSGIADVSDMTDEEVIKTIQKNAEELSQLRDRVLKRKAKNEKYYGADMDPDIIDAITYGDIAYEHSRDRIYTMSNEINSAYESGKKDFENLHKDSGLSEEQKKHIVKYGASDATTNILLKEQKAILEKIKNLQDQREGADRKKRKSIDSKIRALNASLDNINKKTREYNKEKSKINVKPDAVLSEDEIMALSIEDRARILSDDYAKIASKEQKEVIDNLKKILKIGDTENDLSDSLVKIQDSAKLKRSNEIHHELKQKGVKALTEYGRTIKRNAEIRASERRIKDLKDMESYEEFETILNGILNNPKTASIDGYHIAKFLKDDVNYKRFVAKQENTNLIFSKLDQLLNSEESLTDSEIKALYVMGGYLATKEIDVTDLAKVEASLTTENLNDYYNEISEGNTDSNIKFSQELISLFIDKLRNIRQQVEQVREIQTPIETEPTPQGRNNPIVVENDEKPVVEPQPTEEKPGTVNIPEDSFKPSGEFTLKNIIKEAINYCKYKKININRDAHILNTLAASVLHIGKDTENIASAVLVAKSNNGFKETTVSEVKTVLQTFGISASDDAIESVLLSIENANVKVDDKGNISINFNDVTDVVKETVLPYIGSDTENPNTPKSTDKTVTIPINNNNPSIQAAVKKHKVDETVKEGHGETKKYVMVVAATDIEDLIDENKTPLYFVIRDNNGTIDIGGDKYKVIGVVSPEDVGDESTVLGKIHKMTVEQGLHKAEGFSFVKKRNSDDTGYGDAAIAFESFKVLSSAPKHIAKGNENISVDTSLDGEKPRKEPEEVIRKLVKVNVTVKDGIVTETYKSPFTNREVTTTRKVKENEKPQPYLAVISNNGKSPLEGANESVTKIFIGKLDKYITKSGVSFIEMLEKGSTSGEEAEKLFDPRESSYFIAKYFDTLDRGIDDIQSFLQNSIPSIESKIEGDSLVFDDETMSKLLALVEGLNNKLNKYIYSKKVKLQIHTVGNEVQLVFSLGDSIIGIHFPLVVYENVGGIAEPIPVLNGKIGVVQFASDAILNIKEGEKTTLRVAGEEPLFKIQVDYDSADRAKYGYDAKEKDDNNVALESSERQDLAAMYSLENFIRDGVLTISQESADREGWSVELRTSTNSLQSKPKIVKSNPLEAKTSQGLVDGNSGIVLDATVKTSPVTNPSVKAKLDGLVEAKKQRDAYKTTQSNEEIQVETATSRNSHYEGEIDQTVAFVGNLYDSIIRDLLNNEISTAKDISSKYPNISQEEAVKIIEYVNFIVDAFTNAGWTLDAREMYLNTTLPSKTGEGEAVFHGIPDIVAYNAAGEIMIIDIKTFSSADTKDINADINYWSGQTSDYANAITKLTGHPVVGTYVFPIEVSYNKDAEVKNGVLQEGIAISNVESKVRTIGNKDILMKLKYTKLESSAPQPQVVVTAASVLNDDTIGDGSDYDEFMSFIDEDFKTAEEEHKEDCNKS